MSEEKEKLVQVAMNIILHAGNARNDIKEAVELAKKSELEKANDLLKKANDELTLAHKEQTTVIQENIANDVEPNCLMFAHAQDTFMCVNTEYDLSKQIIDLYELVNKKLGV